MIYIATVHHFSPDWIEIQRRYLDRFISEPFRVFASLEGIDREYRKQFDAVIPSKGGHAGKLNLLASAILRKADPDDLIVFLDGDAFPIADPIRPLRQMLDRSALAAVCRTENDGDRQPHPSFCGVTARTWKELPGDWSTGWCFKKYRTDVGANLLYLLESTGTPWAPILRSNRRNLHPVLFGIYGGFVYHHGGAFREVAVTRVDPQPPRDRGAGTKRRGIPARYRRAHGDQDEREERERFLRGVSDRNKELSRRVFDDIKADPDFFRKLL